jgi:hypothetical protein
MVWAAELTSRCNEVDDLSSRAVPNTERTLPQHIVRVNPKYRITQFMKNYGNTGNLTTSADHVADIV